YFMNCFVDGSEPYYTRGYFAQEMYGINNTSLTVYDGYLGSSGARLRPLKAGETYTFNIWAIYYGSSGDSIKSRTGSFRITLLGESGLGEDPIEPPNLSTFYVENGKFHFAFDKIEHSELDSYNVVYSSVDSTPIAGEPNVSLLYSVVNYSDNSNKWINIENMESGKTYYFSITAYYKNGAKLGGNVRTYIVPLNSTAEPTPAPTTEPTAEPTATPTTEPTAAPT
ncbi:MAG: hypothetical protein KAQ68_00335, partial [Clostridiales bacterium]|nr:hypothetical protein [Clostridiales bacterium]